jgi:hypothetical protein
MRIVSVALFFCACLLVAACPAPTYTYARHYADGQVTSFTYTEHQAGATAQITAVAKLTSYVRDGVGGEQVKWVSLTDAGHNLNAQAQAFPPYDLSLDPRAANALALPKQSIPAGLQGPVDDLLTFFVGLSTQAGVANLHAPGDSYVDPKPLSGNFSSATAPVGQDLIQLTTTLTALNSRQATFKSVYQPPPQGGLKLFRSFMNSPVCAGAPNNFQLVEAEGPQYIALWGCESFTITTVVDRASGQLVSVQMTNPLKLAGKLCQDKALTKCTAIPNMQQERLVALSTSS